MAWSLEFSMNEMDWQLLAESQDYLHVKNLQEHANPVRGMLAEVLRTSAKCQVICAKFILTCRQLRGELSFPD